MKADAIGLYLHIPFCVKKCAYCDFCSFPYSDFPQRAEYVSKMCEEIDSYRSENIKVDTVFFGGGTPSLLSGEELGAIVEHIRSSFKLSKDTEFTLEANPKTLTKENLDAYISSGVNRISLGLQSIHEKELKSLGRIHSYDEFLESYELVRHSGIENVNVDLMYGIPMQTKDSFCETLETVTALSPEHLSLYGLIIEEGTPLASSPLLDLIPSEEDEYSMYLLGCKLLKKLGYSHYEISNYAKEGKRSRHNLKYWHNDEYIGIGLAAYSYYKGTRFGNTSDSRKYLFNDLNASRSFERIDKEIEMFEYTMLALRLSEGIDLSEYKRKFGVDFQKSREELIDRYIKLGYASLSSSRFNLTEKGFYVSNTILSELL